MKTLPNSADTMALGLRPYRFTVDSYEAMIAHGILTKYDRVEMLAGEIVEMSPMGPRHAACVARCTRFFTVALNERAIVRVRGAIALPPDSEPEPNLAILRPRDGFYAHANPRPPDVLLVIEVADSSLAYDREIKIPLYGRAGIPEAWLIDLAANRLTRYTAPTAKGYSEARVFAPDAALTPLAFPELQTPVAALLPA